MIRLAAAKTRVLLPFFLIAIGVLTLFSVSISQGAAGRSGRPPSPSEISAYEDQKALEAYKKRNAQIDSRKRDGPMPSDNNAALLYYQAFLQLPDANGTIKTKISDVYGGADPDTQTRIFLGKCLPALELFEVASRMPQCTWGVLSDEQKSRNFLGRQLNNLSFIISADACAIAADGHYRAALEQCLTLRRIARHLIDDPQLCLFSMSCDRAALRTIGRILSRVPLDADVLTWFEGQFGSIQVTPPTLERTLQKGLDARINVVQTCSIGSLRDMLLKRAPDEQAKQDIRDSTDEQIRAQAIEIVRGLFTSISATLKSDTSADQKHAGIQTLISELTEANVKEASTFGFSWTAIVTLFESQVAHTAQINSIKAAVGVYLVVAKTGELPKELPDSLAKDPYTGRDFLYEITDDGFVLRCQRNEFSGWKDLEFKVRRQD